MDKKSLYGDLELKEKTLLAIQLTAAAQRTAITIEEYIGLRRANGALDADILKELIEDLENNGRIFGEFRNAIRATAHGNLRRVSDIGNYTENGVEIKYIWITVGDGRVCPDCEPRHNKEGLWSEWEDTLPGSGWSVCKNYCRCILVPKEAPGFAPDKPIIRKRRS